MGMVEKEARSEKEEKKRTRKKSGKAEETHTYDLSILYSLHWGRESHEKKTLRLKMLIQSEADDERKGGERDICKTSPVSIFPLKKNKHGQRE